MEIALELLGRSVCDDFPFVDDQDSVARCLDFGEDVRGKYDRLRAAKLLDQSADLHDLVRIKAACGLIEDEDVGVMDHRLCEADPLPVSF